MREGERDDAGREIGKMHGGRAEGMKGGKDKYIKGGREGVGSEGDGREREERRARLREETEENKTFVRNMLQHC